MPTFDANDPALEQHLTDGVKAAVDRGLLSFAMRLVTYIQGDLIPNMPRPPVDMGSYRAAWRYRKIPGGVEIYNTAPHAPFIEYGVRAANVKPGTAMITALVKWVKRHGMASDDQEATVIAWKIVKSMQKRGIFNRGGTSGLGILKKALLKLDWIQEEVDREIEKEF